MGQLDDKYIRDEIKRIGSQSGLRDKLDTTGITSRDQIINPYDILDPNSYGQSRREKMRYQSDLARLQEIQKQQQASYEEWYNSPEQAAIREREAGINPDLAGLDNAGSASQVSPSDAVPGANLPTNGEVASNVISGITSVIGSLSSVASLATAFTTLPLVNEQTKNAKKLGEQLDLQNEAQLGTMIASDISDLLATAQQAHIDSQSQGAFDLDGFFANDSNFETLTPIYGSNPRFASQLAKQRKAVLAHQKRAAESQSGLASANWSLANIISDPRYSGDQKLTMIQLRPFVEACVKADSAEVALRESVATWQKKRQDGMDVNLAIDAANASNRASISQSGYTEAYYNEADGELVAAYEQFFRDSMLPSLTLQQSINQGYLDLFNSDPSGEAGYKAAYLFGSNGGSSWEEVYLLRQKDAMKKLVDSKIAVAEATGDYAELQAMMNAFNNVFSLGTDYQSWQKNSAGWAMYRMEVKEYIDNIQKILDDVN